MVLLIITDNIFSTDRMLAANQPDVELQRLIEYRKVLERRNCDQTRPVACDQTLAVSDQLIVVPTVGTTGHIQLGRF